jgi:hypothetical protein
MFCSVLEADHAEYGGSVEAGLFGWDDVDQGPQGLLNVVSATFQIVDEDMEQWC